MELELATPRLKRWSVLVAHIFEEKLTLQQAATPALYVEASVLPKGASIEWQVTYQTGVEPYVETEDDDDQELPIGPIRLGAFAILSL